MLISFLLAFIEVTISWGAPPPATPIVRGYHVYQDGIKVASVTDREYVQNLDFSTPHCWRITSWNYAGESPPSDQLCLGKPAAPPMPSAAFPGLE